MKKQNGYIIEQYNERDRILTREVATIDNIDILNENTFDGYQDNYESFSTDDSFSYYIEYSDYMKIL